MAVVLAVAPAPGTATAGSESPPPVPGCENRDPHLPIRIDADAMFELGPVVGVRNPGANGTAEDPYVIEGWCIRGPGSIVPAPAGISISRTSAHFVIRNNTIHEFDLGVTLTFLSDGIVTRNRLTGTDQAISLWGATDTGVTENEILSADTGAYLRWDARTNDLANNSFEDVRKPVAIQGSNNTVHHNDLSGGRVGVAVTSDPGRGPASDNKIHHNSIRSNAVGVRVDGSVPGTLIEQNRIQDNSEGGLELRNVSDRVDARHNWWGASSGPSGGVTDACTGTVADGDGDAIVTQGGGEVCFDPWSTTMYDSYEEARAAPGVVLRPNTTAGPDSDARIKLLEPPGTSDLSEGEQGVVILVYDAVEDAPITDADFTAEAACNSWTSARNDAFCAWMPAMGHGTAPEDNPEHVAHGEYHGSTYFSMTGDWALMFNPAIDGQVVHFDVMVEVDG